VKANTNRKCYIMADKSSSVEETVTKMIKSFASNPPEDTIYVKDIEIKAVVGVDSWRRARSQPLLVTGTACTSLVDFDKHDDFERTLDYRSILKIIREHDDKIYEDLFHLVRSVASQFVIRGVKKGSVAVKLPRAVLRCEGGVTFVCHFASDNGVKTILPIKLELEDIKLSCIIGINEVERVQRQPVNLGIWIVGRRAHSSQGWASLPDMFDKTLNVSSLPILGALLTEGVGCGRIHVLHG
jgi:dihydroneopterin aldolase